MKLVDDLKAELEATEQKAAALRQAIAALTGEAIQSNGSQHHSSIKRSDYQDLGVTAAAKKFLREVAEPQDTRAIADALLNRGLTTSSKNFIATVYATLNNGKMFRRTKDARWELVPEKGEGA